MAEFCLRCFLNLLKPNAYECSHIVMSDDNDFCEGCNDYAPYVADIDQSDMKICATITDFVVVVSHIRREQKVACVECGSTFENDDLAFVAETGECPYCHKQVSEIWIKD